MTDLPVAEALDPRLRAYLADELRQAELDFQHLRHPTPRPIDRRLAVGTLLAVAALVGVIAGVPALVGTPRSQGRGPVIATDGLPIAIDGEAVLRLGDVAARLGDGSTFLAGGTLMLRASPCPTLAGETPSPCAEDWILSGDPAYPAIVFALESITSASGFVRTSGALTVVRVSSSRSASISGGDCYGECEGILTVGTVIWRQPTKGPIPSNAAPPEGGFMNEALVPDFVSALARDGLTIAGYIPKRYILFPTLGPGNPSNPPQSPPEPVYGEDLTTLVGYMVPGVGFETLAEMGSTSAPASDWPVSPEPLPAATSGVIGPDFGPATWALDPAFPSPGPTSEELFILVWERNCSSGTPTTGRMSAPIIETTPTTVTITIGVRSLSGLQTCPLPPGTPAVVTLPEPLGSRTLLDGGVVPPAPPSAAFQRP